METPQSNTFINNNSVDSLLNYNQSLETTVKNNDLFDGQSSFESAEKSAFTPLNITTIDENGNEHKPFPENKK